MHMHLDNVFSSIKCIFCVCKIYVSIQNNNRLKINARKKQNIYYKRCSHVQKHQKSAKDLRAKDVYSMLRQYRF